MEQAIWIELKDVKDFQQKTWHPLQIVNSSNAILYSITMKFMRLVNLSRALVV